MAKTKTKKKSEFARIMRQLSKNKLAMLGLIIFIIEVVLAILAPYIAPYKYDAMDMTQMFALPSAQHFFGCDDMGRDIFSRILYGAKYSISIGILAILLATVIGMFIGAVAGYFGGWVDNLIMRLLDVIQAIPGMLMMIVISAVLGPGYINTIIAMAFGSIPGMARMLRAQMLKERGNEYIEASTSINCSTPRIIISHLIPNCMSPIIVQATMGVAQTITLAAGLSFIGLGIQPPIPEWGAMLSSARQFIRMYPHLVIFPGLAIAVTVLALNLLGDGLRDALDPKLKN
ncbi:MAG: ABC transporter permease [Marvinbryantia sp.]|uniref:ABC transporter permease n=1 Tax=Marvinbryantia sp. TaxID=2496532 RepID=UPI0025FCDA2B|nr:ABC transporter permease [uncultured Marvinbryantia sp.]